jgi:hypothetical protein
MAKLDGKNTGDELFQSWGPVTGRNYNSGGPRTVTIQVLGSGSVTLQRTNQSIIRSANGGVPNPYTFDRVPDQSTWANVAGAVDIDASSGPVTVTIPAEADYNFIRGIVGSTTGDGRAIFDTYWV